MPILEITTMVGCPLVCKYCPQDKLNKNYPKSSKKFLSLDDFKVILEKLPQDTIINFCGFSEPFSNPNCLDLIKYAAQKKFQLFIYTTLQGASREAINYLCRLCDEGKIARFELHLPDGHNNMPGFKLTEEYLYGIKKVSKQNVVKFMTMSPDGVIHPKVYDYIKTSSLNSIMKKLPHGWRGIRRAGNLQQNKIDPYSLTNTINITKSVSCSYTPFYDQNVLMPNGDVALCCMDYSLKHIIGNLLVDSYSDLFKSKEFLRLMDENRSIGHSEYSLCKSCEKANCHLIGDDGFIVAKRAIEVNGRRTTRLSIALSKYKIPLFILDKVVDFSRAINRFKYRNKKHLTTKRLTNKESRRLDQNLLLRKNGLGKKILPDTEA